ncbi:hypothetical protein L195_g036436 [Trifolium pratense]|uniref:Uncharacterized protein n=1 Tax=Trifolium pratense TaxID=57577 RepID=A0A2K3LPG8_TRIPR|nr:hypothetical protein L195_g036436 [Trifolium pratense]
MYVARKFLCGMTRRTFQRGKFSLARSACHDVRGGAYGEEILPLKVIGFSSSSTSCRESVVGKSNDDIGNMRQLSRFTRRHRLQCDGMYCLVK